VSRRSTPFVVTGCSSCPFFLSDGDCVHPWSDHQVKREVYNLDDLTKKRAAHCPLNESDVSIYVKEEAPRG
jgi:hypothetical protein